MNAFRHRTRFRLSLLAMVALLWSQLAFAAHPGCVAALSAMFLNAPTAATQDCGHDAAPEQDPVCHAHCSQGEASSDTARVPPVAPLLGLPAVPARVLGPKPAMGMDGHAVGRPVPAVRHRPTAHPAELLLI